MTKSKLKKKIIQFVESSDEKILEAVYTILDEHAKAKEDASLLTNSQKAELDKRMKLFESGKMEIFSWDSVYNELKSGKKK